MLLGRRIGTRRARIFSIEYPDLFESSAQVTNHGGDSKGMYLVLNQSLFYPQGGGQPADPAVLALSSHLAI